MLVKGLIDEDFINYKLCSMFIMFPFCSFKCEKECGIKCCQNSSLATAPVIEVSYKELVGRYLNNSLSKAIVFGGLEPLDSWTDVVALIKTFRTHTNDPIIIYTGYREDEIKEKTEVLKGFSNIIIKFGRFVPNDESRFDDVLGVKLASKNQYAIKIS